MRFLWLGLAAGAAVAGITAELRPADSEAFTKYTATVEADLTGRAQGDSFLFVNPNPAQWKELKQGEVVVTASSHPNPREVGHSLIHDWTGVAFIPGVKVEAVLAKLQDFNNHKKIYAPEVVDSRLISKNGSEFTSYLRLRKKKFLTVILNTEYQTRFFQPSPNRAYSIVNSTKIAEVEKAGEPEESEKPVGTGYGFLWRLNSYWQLEARDGGVLVECRAISLTRDVPAAVKLFVGPMVQGVPKESLEATLQNTRKAVPPAPQPSKTGR